MDLSELQKSIGASLDVRDKKYIDELAEANKRLLDIEQKLALKPGFSSSSTDDADRFNFGDLISNSEEHARFAKGLTKEFSFQVPSAALQHKTILNATGSGQPLVASDRLRLINPAAQRMLRVSVPLVDLGQDALHPAVALTCTNGRPDSARADRIEPDRIR